MYKKLFQIAAAFFLLAGAVNTAALAQQDAKTDPIVGAFFYHGVETSPGVFDPNSVMQFGNSIVLKSTGESETRHLIVSLNYYASLPNGGNVFTILGGTWSLITYDNDGQYQGTLYGEVTSGVIEFIADNNGNVLSKRTSAQLRSLNYSNPRLVRRNQIITGTLGMTTNLDSMKTSGTLNLDF